VIFEASPLAFDARSTRLPACFLEDSSADGSRAVVPRGIVARCREDLSKAVWRRSRVLLQRKDEARHEYGPRNSDLTRGAT
jgi:hypothetical protein